MNYISTRDKTVKVSSAQAIAQGISRESGLFVPDSLPSLSKKRLESLLPLDYIGRACNILADFLTDFSAEEIQECVCAAYTGKFGDGPVTPISKISDQAFLLELWHGPTCAFKDMALQLLPHLLTRSAVKSVGAKEIVILVATSGDTGKAALEGFQNVDNTRILVFYPAGGVSKIQYLQMATQQGDNVGVCGVQGNFDDTQTAVKQIFTNEDIIEKLAKKNMMFSSANSINWGRLVPQIVYYISAYLDLVNEGELEIGNPMNVCVPTGNFGNILAAYYAKMMGLPIGKLICASNVNNVLTDFINTGVYDRRRDFILTSSPSMDILISSNLERLLFALYQGDDKAVAGLMSDLSENGFYQISDASKAALQSQFWGGYCTEEETAETIKRTFDQRGYLCDTHTAVAVKVYEDYAAATGDKTKTLIASTANPYKFSGSILAALTGTESALDEFTQAKELSRITGTEIPQQILSLESDHVRFEDRCAKNEMTDYVTRMLGL